MSQPGQDSQAQSPQGEDRRISESYERYDLTGHTIRRWTVKARSKLIQSLRRVFAWRKKAGEAQLPGTDETLGRKVSHLPGKGIEFFEAHIEKSAIENQLKASQTETEFLKQELLREQIAKTRAETEGQKLNTLARQIELQEMIREVIAGKTGIRVISQGEKEIVVVGNLPPLPSEINDDFANEEPSSHLRLSPRTKKRLRKHGITALQQLAACSRSELLAMSGIGPKTLKEIEDALQHYGISLEN